MFHVAQRRSSALPLATEAGRPELGPERDILKSATAFLAGDAVEGRVVAKHRGIWPLA
jgi:hypothetical protein